MDREERKEIADFLKEAGETPSLLIGTKNDLTRKQKEGRVQYDLKISAREGENIDRLKKLMKERALENNDYDSSSLLVTSSRHRDALHKTREHVRSAIDGLKK